jgi:hypothetical protein
MRILKEITLPSGLKASLFSWNGKYILKLENGLLEQIYKVSESDVSGLAEVESLLQDFDFEQKVLAIFIQMEENLEKLW